MAEHSALKTLIDKTAAHMPNIDKAFEKVVRGVSDKYGVPAQDILSKSRSTRKVIPRHHACWLLVSAFKFPLTDVAGLFDMDHTSVMYACKRHEERMNGGAENHR